MQDFALWWTDLTRGQQDIAVLVIVFIGSLLAVRWGMYDADKRTQAEGRTMRVPHTGRTLLLWGLPTALTLFLAWGMRGY